MAPLAYIRIRNFAGTIVSVLTGAGSGDQGDQSGFFDLAWSKKRNSVDYASFSIAYDNPDRAQLQDKYILEIRRSDLPDVAEYTSFQGFIRDLNYVERQGRIYITVGCYGTNHLLEWREVAWPAETTNRTVFTTVQAETVMKTLVSYNATALATVANGRDTDGAIAGFSVQADAALGNNISYAATRKGLLATLQDVARIAGGDFAVVALTPTAYEFRYYNGQLGTNRTTGPLKVVFSLDNENMKEPKLSVNRSQAKTKAIVGGQGQGNARTIRVRTSADYNVTTNNVETFVDGRRTDNTAALDSIGDAALEAQGASTLMSFEVIQTPRYRAESEYFLGDRVTADFAGVTTTHIIDKIAFSYTPGRQEQVDVDTVQV